MGSLIINIKINGIWYYWVKLVCLIECGGWGLHLFLCNCLFFLLGNFPPTSLLKPHCIHFALFNPLNDFLLLFIKPSHLRLLPIEKNPKLLIIKPLLCIRMIFFFKKLNKSIVSFFLNRILQGIFLNILSEIQVFHFIKMWES